jgi:nicotinate-nucleotide adenylyltransferase
MDHLHRLGSVMRPKSWIRPPAPIADGARIGLLGGSFNPAHEGHLHATLLPLKQLRLDAVWWLVSPLNPLKRQEGMASFEARLALAKTFARHPKIVATAIEADLGTRYTVETIKVLKRRFPHVRFVWLMGSDNLVQFPRWRRWQEIFALIPIAVVARPGTALSARCSLPAIKYRNRLVPADARVPFRAPPCLTILDSGRRNPLSATQIRAASRG